jgi:hypothetical protein
MTSANQGETSVDSEVERIRAVVPPRAVLTELARGFLLVHESNPARAVRFAETFLKEQVGRVGTPRVEPVLQLTLARLSLGRFPRGPVEPPGWPASP